MNPQGMPFLIIISCDLNSSKGRPKEKMRRMGWRALRVTRRGSWWREALSVV